MYEFHIRNHLKLSYLIYPVFLETFRKTSASFRASITISITSFKSRAGVEKLTLVGAHCKCSFFCDKHMHICAYPHTCSLQFFMCKCGSKSGLCIAVKCIKMFSLKSLIFCIVENKFAPQHTTVHFTAVICMHVYM